MFKKIGSILLALTVVITLFAGCNSNSPKVKLDPKKPVTINLWHYYNDAQKNAFDELVAEFNETVGIEQGIILEAVNQGNVGQLTESVINSANNKVGSQPIPNIFAAYADTAYQVDKMGLVASLDDYLTSDELAQYIPSYIEEGRMGAEKQLKIFPTAKSTEILVLNKTDWDKFAKATGTDMTSLGTIEGLTKTAKAYYEWTDSLTPAVANDGKALFGRDAMANYFIIGSKQLGKEIFSVNEQNKVDFQVDEAVMRKLWDNYYVPFISGYFTASGRFRTDDAKIGEIIAMVGASTSATFFPQQVRVNDTDGYPIEVVSLPAPLFEGGERYAVQQGAGMVVSKSTPEQEYASVVFLKWFTEADRNIEFATKASYLPVKTQANDVAKLNIVLNADKDAENYEVKKQSMEISVETVNSHTLYTNKAFDGGTKARNVLEFNLSDKAVKDRTEVVAMLDKGTSLAEAVSSFNTDENFNTWLQSLKQALAATQEG